MRSKANNFIGGLHNSAAIPGVIVFPLRLSCRDESLMHSCLGIMDGTGQPLPSTRCRRWERRGNEWGREGVKYMEDMYGPWDSREWNEQSEGRAEERVRICV